MEGQRVLDHVRVLASDSCAGRGPGSAGIEKAAAYITDYFSQLRLRQGGRAGYADTFSMTTGIKTGPKNTVSFGVLIERPGVPLDQTKPIQIGWKVGADYQPYGFSESGVATGDIAFVGYGITSSSYDDYAGIDVKGKIAIMLRGLPKWAEKNESMRQLSSILLMCLNASG
jgi:hypothetical protein